MAIDLFGQQLAIAQEIGDRRAAGYAHFGIPLVKESLGEAESAISEAGASYLIYHAAGSPHAAKVAAWLRERGVDPDSL